MLVALVLVAVLAGGCGASERAGETPSLADVVALMRTADESTPTIVGALHSSADFDVITRQGNRNPPALGDPPLAERDVPMSDSRLWLERPSRLRLEQTSGAGQLLTIHNGDMELHTFLDGPATLEKVEVRDAAESSASFLLNPQPLVAHRVLDVVGTEMVVGRPAIILRGTPDPAEPQADDILGLAAADEVRIWVDRATGLALRYEASVDGKRSLSEEFTELSLDAAIPPATFALTPPPGVELLSADDFRPRRVSVAEAAALVPFPLWAPPDPAAYATTVARLPDGAYDVTLSRGSGPSTLVISERPAGRQGDVSRAGAVVVRGGTRMYVASDEIVTFERDGTWVEVQGPGGRKALLALASSLRPLPRP